VSVQEEKRSVDKVTLPQKYAHLVVFANDLLYGTTSAIPNEDVGARAYG